MWDLTIPKIQKELKSFFGNVSYIILFITKTVELFKILNATKKRAPFKFWALEAFHVKRFSHKVGHDCPIQGATNIVPYFDNQVVGGFTCQRS